MIAGDARRIAVVAVKNDMISMSVGHFNSTSQAELNKFLSITICLFFSLLYIYVYITKHRLQPLHVASRPPDIEAWLHHALSQLSPRDCRCFAQL